MILLSYVATNLSGGKYRYTEGMISPAERDLVVWLISCIVLLVATRAGPPVGPWVNQELQAVTELLMEEGWGEDMGLYLPPVLRNLVNLFRTGGGVRGRTSGSSVPVRSKPVPAMC